MLNLSKKIIDFINQIPYTNATYRSLYCQKFVNENANCDIVTELKQTLQTNDDFLIAKFLAGQTKECPICHKQFYKKSKACSHECSRIQRNNTFLEKYGVKSTFEFEGVQDKIVKNVKAKYGVDNVFQSEQIKAKIKQTCLKKYGVENAVQSQEVQNKYKQTCLKKYGVSNISQSQLWKTKVQETYQKHYNSDYYFQSNNFKKLRNDREIKNLLSSLKDKIDNYKDLTCEFLTKYIIEKNNELVFDVKACETHFGIRYPIIKRIKRCFNINVPNYVEREARSADERELFNWIPCNNKISNDRKIIYPNELDIVLPDYKLAIEYNGVYWHSDFYKEENYHLEKTLKCQNQGYQLFHIFESDDIDIWKSMISNKLGLKNNKIGARKCIVKEITNSDAKSFCAQNHLQGACNAKINLGLFYNDELLEVMTFGKPRYNKHYEFELLRLCTKKYYSVIGGASKLWKCFCQKYSPKSVISYANRRFSNGNIYETLGFKFLNESKPNYWYVKNGELFSRVQCQKHKLKTFLENYDENLSEVDNMLNNDYVRIFDCGNLVYKYETCEN